ncbi:MAG: hypothetical protein WCD70_07275 [Alphaproteobacteria bacterium]
MESNVPDDPFLIGGFALIVVAVLASTAFIDSLKKRNSPLYTDLCSDLDELDRNDLPLPSLTEPDNLYAHNRLRLRAREAARETSGCA